MYEHCVKKAPFHTVFHMGFHMFACGSACVVCVFQG